MPVITDSQRLAIRPFNPRRTASAIPDTDVHEMPTRCLTVNAKWASHILGILDLLAQPDSWKGTESEKYNATQQIEEIILALSTPCVECAPCKECEDCPKEEPIYNVAGGMGYTDESEDYEMGQVVTDVTLDSEGNIVVHYGPCCEKTLSGLSIPKDGEIVAGGKEPLVEKPNEVNQEDWSCRLAYACVTLLEQVATGINNHASLPNTFVNWCKDNIKLCDWSTSSLTKIYYLWIGWSLVPLPGLDSDWTDVDSDMIRNRWANVIEGKSSELTAEDFNAMKQVLRSYFGASRGLGWQTTMDYITRDRFQQAIDNADLSSVQDCSDPSTGEQIPSVHDWSFVFDFTQGPYNFTSLFPYAGGTGNRWEAGRGWVSYPEGDKGWPVQIWARAPYAVNQGDPACTVTYVKIYYSEWGNTAADWPKIWASIYAYANITGETLQQQPAHVWQGETGDIADRYLTLNGSNDWWLGNTGRQFVVSKIVVAGKGTDRFTGCLPDGTLE